MAGRADLTDGEIKESMNQVKAGKLGWFLIGHVPKSDVKFKVTHKGNGGIEELKNELNDGKVQFGYIGVDLSGVKKFVFISWCGEGVAGMKKGYFNGQSQDVAHHFHGFHVQVNARNEDDINNDGVLSKVQKATGASFYRQHQGQDTESRPEASSITYEAPKLDQSTENRPQTSSIKYEAPKLDQSTESRPQSSGIKYEAPKLDQSTENKPQASKLPGHLPPQSAPSAPPSKPAPAPVAAPPKPAPPKPAPPPVVEEPVQQEAQEESYEETYAQEEYAEEQYANEGGAEEASQGTCRALYDYEGEKEGDLPFKEGEIITILDKSDPSGWWHGSVNGVSGYFPMNFVEEI